MKNHNCCRWTLIAALTLASACADPAADESDASASDALVSPIPTGGVTPVGGDGEPGGAATSGGATPPEGGQPGPSGGAVSPPLGGEDPSPVGGLPEGGAPAPGVQLLVAITLAETPQADESNATVSVAEPAPFDSAPGCVTTQVNPGDPAAPLVQYDGGAITVAGLADGARTFTYQGAGYAADRPTGAELFGPGAALTAQGAGGPALPAFEIALTAPADLNISSPRDLFTQSAGGGLTVTWGAGAAESILITVIPVAPFSADPVAGSWTFCGVEDTGSFTVPAANLSPIAGGGLGQSVLIGVTRTRLAFGDAGEHQVVMSALTSRGVVGTLRR